MADELLLESQLHIIREEQKFLKRITKLLVSKQPSLSAIENRGMI